MKATTLSRSALRSCAAPTNSTPRSLYSRWTLAKSGISTLQGTHQVAQKLTTTIFPLRSVRACFWPSRSFSASFGAAVRLSFGIRSSSAAAAGHDWPAASPTTRRIPANRVKRMTVTLFEVEAPSVPRHDQIVGKRRVAVRSARGVRHALLPVAIDGNRDTEREGVVALAEVEHRLDGDGDAGTTEALAAAEQVLDLHAFSADADGTGHRGRSRD